jgi:hypothetical protein
MKEDLEELIISGGVWHQDSKSAMPIAAANRRFGSQAGESIRRPGGELVRVDAATSD